MTHPWQAPALWFALFNLIGAPVVGRSVWTVIGQLHAKGDLAVAAGVSTVGAIGILAVNVGLTWWATRAGLPRGGQMALWLITGGTFALTIAAGVFSPINLVIALAMSAGM